MRIAIVTPYSWTYGGGVNRHVESLAAELIERSHEVRVLAPYDPPDRRSRLLHRAPADLRSAPDYLIPLGRTIGFKANGAVSNISLFPDAVTTMRRELRAGGFDVVHVPGPVLVLGCLLVGRCAGRRDLPRLLDEAAAEQARQPPRRAAKVQPASRADRRLGGRGVDRSALVRRHL